MPQTLLPLMPLLKEELEVESSKQRLGAVDLVARLLTQHPGGGAIIDEYEALLGGLLGRACDKEVRACSSWLGNVAVMSVRACGWLACLQSGAAHVSCLHC